MIISNSLLYDLVGFTVAFLVVLISYYKWAFTYWKKVGLEFIEPSIPFGNARRLFTQKASWGEQFMEFYFELKRRGLQHGGIYFWAKPTYIPIDPEIIKCILQKDFTHFVNRGFYVNEKADPLTGNLFSTEGSRWKELRAKLTSTFTSGKMKMMFDTVAKCSEGLDSYLEESATTHTPFDVKEVLARFTTDVITSCAFGLESESLKNPDSQFRHIGRRVSENSAWEIIKVMMTFAFPRRFLSSIQFKSNKSDVEKFILDVVEKTVNYREKNNVHRKDFLHLLLQIRNGGRVSDEENGNKPLQKAGGEVSMSMNEVAAQVFVFFVAGFETSATTMTFALFELAKNQKLQDKLRSEIDRVLEKHNGNITYDALMEMNYMENVINESLRKYTPLPVLNRICNKPYHVPNTDIHLEEGTNIAIPLQAIHNDPDYYPQPHVFDPDRFDEDGKRSRPGITFIPFGEGPRICIGMRFGMMQTKVGLTALLRHYRVTLNKNTPQEISFHQSALIQASKEMIWLDVHRV